MRNNPPGSSEYRSPLEMCRFRYATHYEDSEVTDPSEIERLQLGDFASNESADLPCTEEQIEELRKLGRLDSDERNLRRDRAACTEIPNQGFQLQVINERHTNSF